MTRPAWVCVILIGCHSAEPAPPIRSATAAPIASPIASATPPAAVAEGPRLAEIVAIAKKSGPGSSNAFGPPDVHTRWALYEQECRAVLGKLDPLPRPNSEMFHCELETQLDERAVVLTLQWRCTGACTRRYIATETMPLRQMWTELNYIAVLPSLDAFVVDVKEDCSDGSKCRLRLERVALAGARTPFADCFAPMVSPGRKWIVCRNTRGDVMQVPVTGGTPKVHTATPQPNPFPFTGVYFGGMYPDRLQFDNPTTIHAVWFKNGAATQVPLPWSE